MYIQNKYQIKIPSEWIITPLTAEQSSTYNNQFASKAIDRNLTTASHTNSGAGGWLIVHLPRAYRIYDVVVVNGKLNSFYSRLDGAEVILLNEEQRAGSCGTLSVRSDRDTIKDQTYRMSCDGVTATDVKIQQSGTNTESLVLMEVEVQGIGKF